jgi:hypothetical protein
VNVAQCCGQLEREKYEIQILVFFLLALLGDVYNVITMVIQCSTTGT